ncbi:hypothetical protein HID58_050351 [Brassica napus]|uniref:(rape) hypothetical protein n=1 Tax=Brassica napus TaxID=3708 RepID=A0A078JN80_BRANA|nr:hypothetical protein HID58_050351 [Brassica napus]CAF1696720.1 unnamed protein product [Brassica napus]CDY66792.1 BnaUnng01680D [Brassica napus]
MEAEDQHPSHYFNLYEGDSSQNDHFNLQNPQNDHDHDHDQDLHVHDHCTHPQASSVVIDQEKRLRRMVSNRESARRSRMRKRKQIREKKMHVEQLTTSNYNLYNKVISLLERTPQILHENSQLEEKLSYFHQYFMEDRMVLPGNNIDCDITRQYLRFCINQLGK